MNSMIMKKELENALKPFRKIVPHSSGVTCLRCIKLKGNGVELGKKCLEICGTNLQVSMVSSIDSEFEGEICVNLRQILGALKGIKGGEIALELAGNNGDGERLRLSQNGSSYCIDTIPADEFPVLPVMEAAERILSMPAETLAGVLRKCRPVVSDDTTRPYIYGINMKTCGDGTARFEATDGHRLIVEAGIEAEVAKSGSHIIHFDAIGPLIEIMEKRDGTVDVFETSGNLFFGIEGCQVVAKKVDSEFPPVDSVIPNDPVMEVKFQRVDMMEAAREAKGFCSSGMRGNTMKMRVNETRIRLSVDGHDARFEKEIPCVSNGRISMGFNPKYIVDALSVLDGEEIMAEITSATDGLKIREEGTTIVVMPIRLDEEEKPIIVGHWETEREEAG